MLQQLCQQSCADLGKQTRQWHLICFNRESPRHTLERGVMKWQNVVFEAAPELRLVAAVNGVDLLEVI